MHYEETKFPLDKGQLEFPGETILNTLLKSLKALQTGNPGQD